MGQKSVKFFAEFLENLRHQKDILKLTDLFKNDFESLDANGDGILEIKEVTPVKSINKNKTF